MRLEESLYGGIIQKRKIGNRYICNIDFINFPPIGGGGFGNGFGAPKLKPIEPFPKLKIEPYKPYNPLDFGDGTSLTSTPGTQKIVDNNTGWPLIRLDSADNHKPFDHIQYGVKPNEFDPGRTGEEAIDIWGHIIFKKFGGDLDKK